MQHARNAQYELLYRYVEDATVQHLHLISAGHGADLCRQDRATGIFEVVARLDDGLLAHHAFAFHFLHVIVGIGDDPVAMQQLHRVIALIGDGDGVGEDVAVIGLIGLVGEVTYLNGNVDLVLVDIFHRRISPYFV